MLALLEHPNLDPVIFWVKKPELALRWYGLMYVLAFTAGYLIFRWLQKSGYLRIKPEDVTNYIIVGVLGTFLGGRIGYVLFYQFDKLVLGKGVADIWERLRLLYAVWDGGMSFHGGVFGVVLALYLYARKKKHNFWNMGDAAVHIVPLGVALVRIGNFLNGELYGRTIADETGKPVYDADKLPWYAMKFPTEHHDQFAARRLREALERDYLAAHPGVDPDKIPLDALQPLPLKPEVWGQVEQFFPGRWPSQLVQFLFEGVLLLLLIWLLRRWFKRPGEVGCAFLMGYAIFRIPAEIIRQPDSQIDPAKAAELGGTAAFLHALGLTMGQFLSVVIFLWGVGMWYYIRRRISSEADYSVQDRRSGFLRETLRDLPEIVGLRKPKPADTKPTESKPADAKPSA